MPAQSVRQLGELLLDVHGQMEYQSLVRTPAQRALLDHYGRHLDLVARGATTWRRVAELRGELAEAEAAGSDRASQLDLIRYHVAELDALALEPNEFASLHVDRQRLAQSGRLAEGSREVATLLSGSDDASVDAMLARAVAVTRGLTPIDAALIPAAQLLDEALISVREASATVERYTEKLEQDPGRQEWLETRLAAIEAVARKHRIDAAGLGELHTSLRDELESLDGLATTLDGLRVRIAAAETAWQAACTELSRARLAAANALAEAVTERMQGLGMTGGSFGVRIEEVALAQAGENGQDAVEFLVSANPGQPLRSLAKVASGGELSRISLAIQVAALEGIHTACLVFDEVDAGVGGGVAEMVGRLLRTLGSRAQVLCVTHLPQVASQAHHHMRVAKSTVGDHTRTTIASLDRDERVEEIARMLGGVETTDKARDHAREMLAEAVAVESGRDRRRRRRGGSARS
jgi:DNA repair protein RecN (Recombination protein N)